MRVFVSEYVCGGGWPDGCPTGSLRTEGEAMLTAAVADFARVPGCQVATTWDRRLGPFPIVGMGIDVAYPETDHATDERGWFERLASECDATLVIAPEFHGLLATRCEMVERCEKALLGPSSDIVRLCGDKLELARRLGASDVAIVATVSLPPESEWPSLPFPIAIKPRCGAGAVNTFLVPSAAALAALHERGFDPPDLPPDVWQPYVEGRSLSASVIVSGGGQRIDTLSIGEQIVQLMRVESPASLQPADNDNMESLQFSYEGGTIPAGSCNVLAVEQLVRRACASLGPGVRGYLGFDVIAPPDGPPAILEINPRLTTSYIGYRRMTAANLAACILAASRGEPIPPISWQDGRSSGPIARQTFQIHQSSPPEWSDTF